MPRQTLHLMICSPTQGLGYCCEWVFFSCFRSTRLIAARLGVSPRTVRMHKKAARESGCCEKLETCLFRRPPNL